MAETVSKTKNWFHIFFIFVDFAALKNNLSTTRFILFSIDNFILVILSTVASTLQGRKGIFLFADNEIQWLYWCDTKTKRRSVHLLLLSYNCPAPLLFFLSFPISANQLHISILLLLLLLPPLSLSLHWGEFRFKKIQHSWPELLYHLVASQM